MFSFVMSCIFQISTEIIHNSSISFRFLFLIFLKYDDFSNDILLFYFHSINWRKNMKNESHYLFTVENNHHNLIDSCYHIYSNWFDEKLKWKKTVVFISVFFVVQIFSFSFLCQIWLFWKMPLWSFLWFINGIEWKQI